MLLHFLKVISQSGIKWHPKKKIFLPFSPLSPSLSLQDLADQFSRSPLENEGSFQFHERLYAASTLLTRAKKKQVLFYQMIHVFGMLKIEPFSIARTLEVINRNRLKPINLRTSRRAWHENMKTAPWRVRKLHWSALILRVYVHQWLVQLLEPVQIYDSRHRIRRVGPIDCAVLTEAATESLVQISALRRLQSFD